MRSAEEIAIAITQLTERSAHRYFFETSGTLGFVHWMKYPHEEMLFEGSCGLHPRLLNSGYGPIIAAVATNIAFQSLAARELICHVQSVNASSLSMVAALGYQPSPDNSDPRKSLIKHTLRREDYPSPTIVKLLDRFSIEERL